MNLKYITIIFQALAVTSIFAEVKDPVKDYLARSASGEGYRAQDPFYADDVLRRYDIDLNNDGVKEVIITSTHEGQGKQGYLYYVYKQTPNGYEFVGTMGLSLESFYLGKIDEIGAYGIVHFFPSGGQTGGYAAYVFDGKNIEMKSLGARVRNAKTGLIEGPLLDDKYFGDKAVSVEQFVTTSTPEQLASKYGVRTDPRNSSNAVISPSPPQVSGRQHSTEEKTLPTKQPVTALPEKVIEKIKAPSILEFYSNVRSYLPWLAAIIIAVIGLLWLLLKKRK